jgi:hypothetical protein
MASDAAVLAKSLPEDVLLKFQETTSGYWKDLRDPSKRVMVLRMAGTTFVRNAGVAGEEYTPAQVNGNYPVLQGLDYKNNHPTNVLYYIEV